MLRAPPDDPMPPPPLPTATGLALAAALGHERVVVVQERSVGLRAVIAIHDSTFGPAAGGTRLRAYPSFDDAVVDALLLSRAMTYKAAFAEMEFGGAKAVIDLEPGRAKTPALLEAFARAVAELEGRFVTGCDMGIDQDDVAFMARFSKAFEHTPKGQGPDSSELTAIGVLAGIRATAARLGRGLGGLRVAVQGVGEVGGRLAKLLAEAGARVAVADVVAARAEAVARATGAELVDAEGIVASDCDLFSPNAAGGVIGFETLPRARFSAICGAANNPLASAEVADELDRRGILYAPDFVANGGGSLSLLFEQRKLDEAGTLVRVERIGLDLTELYEEAAAERIAPLRVAERRVEARLTAARARD
jgi:leucine dehydrogenase